MSTVYLRFAARRSDSPQRSPLIEELIARAAPTAIVEWRADALRAIAVEASLSPESIAAAPAAVAVAALERSAAAPTATQSVWACVATPVALTAGMSSVIMPEDGVLAISVAEAERLAAEFNTLFADAEVRMAVGCGDVLLCLFQSPLDVTSHDPERVAGHDVFAFQATGPDAPRLRRLMSEIEMWLFEHALNHERSARGVPPITGLWLWGGSSNGTPLPRVRGFTAGRDPLFAAFGDTAIFPGTQAAVGGVARGAATAGVIVVADHPGSPTWAAVETRWLAPAVAALRAGRISCLELCAGGRSFRLTRAQRLRFWRTARPWWEAYALD